MIRALYCRDCVKVGSPLCHDRAYAPSKAVAEEKELIACHSYQGIDSQNLRLDQEEIRSLIKTERFINLQVNESELEVLYLVLTEMKELVFNGEVGLSKSLMPHFATALAIIDSNLKPILEKREKKLSKLERRQPVPPKETVNTYQTGWGYLARKKKL